MKSYRRILAASSLIGGSTAINILVGIVKVKVLALLLGPAGIGLMGIYQNVVSTAATIFGLGLEGSGVRKLASSSGDDQAVSLVQRTLWISNVTLGLIAVALLMLFQQSLSMLLFDTEQYSDSIAWLGVGVFFSLVASSQTAVIQGMRRVADLARVNIYGAIGGAASGVLAIFILGDSGLVAFVVTAPVFSAITALFYAKRLTNTATSVNDEDVLREWYGLLKLGVPMMIAALATLVTQLVARSLVLKELGVDAAGYYQAAWAISMTYIGFVLTAMGADYFPRLSAAINDHAIARRMVNEQTEVSLLLVAPLFIGMFIFASWVITLLYSDSFGPAIELLRWQIMGDVLKVLAWPMGFIVLAQGRGGLFVFTQLNWNAVYLITLWLGLSDYGLVVVGVSFLVAYIIQVIVVRLIAGSLIGFKWRMSNVVVAFCLMLVCSVAMVMTAYTNISGWGYLVGGLVVVVFSAYSVHRLNKLMDFSGWIRGAGLKS